MAGVVYIPWYATVFRQDSFAEAVTTMAPLAFRFGASQYQVHRSLDDRYKITQMIWFEDKQDWYRFWESSDMIEFRARHAGHYQIPVVYGWHEEIGSGALGPEVPQAAPAPDPEPEPANAA